MSVEAYNIIFHGSATMPDDDSTTQIGGAIDKSTRVTFAPLDTTGTLKAVSSAAGDTTQSVTVYGRNAAGEKINETINLNGTTFAAGTESFERIMKATKSATTTGDVCVVESSAEASGTAQDGDTNEITLAAGASAVDNFYQFMILITDDGDIREIVEYNGTTKVAKVRTWDNTPDSSTTYEIYNGVIFDKSPNEIDEVRRVFYDAAANPSGGAEKVLYEKVFVYNQHATLALTNAVIDEVDEGAYATIEFALETTLDGTGTNGSGNDRYVAPSSGVGSFSSDAKNVVNSQNFSPQSGQGVWLKLTLAAGSAAAKTYYKLQTQGQST